MRVKLALEEWVDLTVTLGGQPKRMLGGKRQPAGMTTLSQITTHG